MEEETIESLSKIKLKEEIQSIKRSNRWYNSGLLTSLITLVLAAIFTAFGYYLSFNSEAEQESRRISQAKEDLEIEKRKIEKEKIDLEKETIEFKLIDLNSTRNTLNDSIRNLKNAKNILTSDFQKLRFQNKALGIKNSKLSEKEKLIKKALEYSNIQYELEDILNLMNGSKYRFSPTLIDNIRNNVSFKDQIIKDLKKFVDSVDDYRVNCIAMFYLSLSADSLEWKPKLLEKIDNTLKYFSVRDSAIHWAPLDILYTYNFSLSEKLNMIKSLLNYSVVKKIRNEETAFKFSKTIMLIYYYQNENNELINQDIKLYLKCIRLNLEQLNTKNIEKYEYAETLLVLSPQTYAYLYFKLMYDQILNDSSNNKIILNEGFLRNSLILSEMQKHLKKRDLPHWELLEGGKYLNSLNLQSTFDVLELERYMNVDKPVIEQWLNCIQNINNINFQRLAKPPYSFCTTKKIL